MIGPTILVLEDELPLLRAIQTKLELGGFQVLTARSVAQALNHINDVDDISAIWLDHYLLGKEDGLDFVRECKAVGHKCSRIPMFVVSNTASDDKVKTYLKLGVSDYFVKAEKSLDVIITEIKNSLDIEEYEQA
jgi:DNA-binding response OmpR family regulator